MRLLLLNFCCWLIVTSAESDSFYFPDQLPAKADAQSSAWTDGAGNSQASANAVASAGGSQPPVHLSPPVEYPTLQPPYEPIGGHGHHGNHEFGGGYQPTSGHGGHELGGGFQPFSGHGGHELGGGFNQGYQTGPVNNQPYPSFNGGSTGQSNAQANANAQSNTQGSGGPQSTSQSNAQANSQNFANGNTISNAVSNTLTNGPNGEASASAAAAAAGVTFVNGIPVATASAAASVASTAPGAGTVSSSSHSGGPQQNGPNFNYAPNNNYPGPPYQNRPEYGRENNFNGPYDGINGGPYDGYNGGPYNGPNNIYGQSAYQQPWFYRSAWDKKDGDENATDAVLVESDFNKRSDRISKSSEPKIPEFEGSIVIFKD